MDDENIFGAVTVTLNPAIDQTATISNFSPGEVNRVEDVRSNAGGKGVNVAAALADYGFSVAATGFLGRENTAIFEELFRAKDIADHFVRIEGQTRLGIKVVDPERRETTDINFPGPAPSPLDIETLRSQVDVLSAVDHAWFVLGGSVPPGVPVTIYREFVEMLREREQRVVLDTSGEPLRHAIEARPHVVKPNVHELEALLGRPLDSQEAIIRAARDLLSRGIEMVVVSRGPQGALFVTPDRVLAAIPPSVQVRTTVGAGDAMVAGIVASQLRHVGLEDCARLATAFSLEALVRGEAGISSLGGLEFSMDEVTIESVT